jgi:hypothetical protein
VNTLDVKCHFCKVKPGEFCVDKSGNRRTGGHHAVRIRFAQTGNLQAVGGMVSSANKLVKNSGKRSVKRSTG